MLHSSQAAFHHFNGSFSQATVTIFHFPQQGAAFEKVPGGEIGIYINDGEAIVDDVGILYSLCTCTGLPQALCYLLPGLHSYA